MTSYINNDINFKIVEENHLKNKKKARTFYKNIKKLKKVDCVFYYDIYESSKSLHAKRLLGFD